MEQPQPTGARERAEELDQERRNRFAGIESCAGAVLILVGVAAERFGTVFDVLGIALGLAGAATIAHAYAVGFELAAIPERLLRRLKIGGGRGNAC
jgi:hypothetical protein